MISNRYRTGYAAFALLGLGLARAMSDGGPDDAEDDDADGDDAEDDDADAEEEAGED